MKEIKQLHQQIGLSTLKFVIFYILTLGFYDMVWLYSANNAFEKCLNTKVKSATYLIMYVIVCAWSNFFLSFPDEESYQIFLAIGACLNFVQFVMGFIWANSARYQLTYHCLAKHNIQLKTHTIYVLLFNYFYINYLINQLAKLELTESA